MQAEQTVISAGGKAVTVPSFHIAQRRIVVTGRWLRVARLDDEEWIESQTVNDPEPFILELKNASPKADVFTFAQDLSESQPKYSFPFEWEDVAAVPITTYSDWWEALPQESRKNVRRAGRKGVVVKLASFDDDLVQGIKAIYDETPIRQGRPFWHYGKALESVRHENSSFLDRSNFVAAYCGSELIGFIKIVYVGKIARIMQILSKNAHLDKHPPNALLAKAMETCCQRGMTHFIYGKYFYGNKGDTPLTEFKRRNGFQRLRFPRYFVPLTLKGRVAMALRLHLGAKNLIPSRLANILLHARARFYQRKLPNTPAASGIDDGSEAKTHTENAANGRS
jgi:hypothetical protein